jgi:hypothetical protein
MPDPQRPLAPHTLRVPAARTLSNPTLTVPQMLAESPRWLLHLLPWLNIQGGVYQVNLRRIVLRQSDRIAAHLVDDKATIDVKALRGLSLLRTADEPLLTSSSAEPPKRSTWSPPVMGASSSARTTRSCCRRSSITRTSSRGNSWPSRSAQSSAWWRLPIAEKSC